MRFVKPQDFGIKLDSDWVPSCSPYAKFADKHKVIKKITYFSAALVIVFFCQEIYYNMTGCLPMASIFGYDVKITTFTIIIQTFAFPITWLVVAIIHELLHAIVMPAGLFSKNIMICVTASDILITCLKPCSRNRYIFISICPVIIITILPVFLMFISGYINFYIMLAAAINLLGSIYDITGAFTIATTIPKQAEVCFGHWRVIK